MNMNRIISEITPLTEQDCFYLAARYKNEFDFPVHTHKEIELNLVVNCEGCQRIVGDSVSTLKFLDLVLIGGNLIHGWHQNGVPRDRQMREITIQWSPTMISGEALAKKQFLPIKKLFERCAKGVEFGQSIIRHLIPKFEELVTPQPGFIRYLRFMEILYILATTEDYKILSTSSFVQSFETDINSKRIQKIQEYIFSHYFEQFKLEDLADIAGLTSTSLSRFFKQVTHQTLTDFVLEVRLGNAIRSLVDTDKTISEICYESGFNNLSNFNRLFKKKKGCCPQEFRMKYNKTKIII